MRTESASDPCDSNVGAGTPTYAARAREAIKWRATIQSRRDASVGRLALPVMAITAGLPARARHE